MSTRKKIFSTASVIILVLIILIGGRFFIFNRIEKKIRETARSLEEDSIFIKFDSLYTDPWRGSLTIIGLKGFVSNGKRDTTDSITRASISAIKIEGINILPLLLHRELSIDVVHLKHPTLSWIENFHLPKNKSDKKNKNLSAVLINRLTIDSASFEVLDTLYQESKKLRLHNLDVAGIHIETKEKIIHWGIGSSSLDSLTMHFAREFYTLHVNKSRYSAADKTMQIDSIHLIPDYDKHIFAKKSIRQTDRIQAFIPSVKAQGFAFNEKGKPSIEISRVLLNFRIEVYRDKRYPFHNNTKVLPERFLHTLPVTVQIDTVQVNDSHVLYEEFPESGDSAGYVYFDKLHASLYNLSNVSTEEAKMEAEASLMDTGKLKIHFTFPANPDKDYTASGTLTNFSLPKLNSMLKPLVNASIQSGTLQEMKFKFLYNDHRSDGHVILNYTDLKMLSGKKSNLGSKVITLLLNTFIRNNMDKDTAAGKKRGTILFYRDHQRAIFNYWWKSLLSGIKSVYNLDKVTNTSSNKKK